MAHVLIEDSDIAAARADLVVWCSSNEVLKGYTAEQLEALAFHVAADRLRQRRMWEQSAPPSRDEIVPEAGGEG